MTNLRRHERHGRGAHVAALTALLISVPFLPAHAHANGHSRPEPEEIVVTAQRRPEPLIEEGVAIRRLGAGVLSQSQARHPNEIFRRVAGMWVLQGSGQEHQAALRSPILGGAGGCAGLLYLENGIPVRPAGFCTINQLTELAIDLADAVEVLRGPGTAVHGSNAVHGVVNVLMPGSRGDVERHASVGTGSDGFARVRFSMPIDDARSTNVSGAWSRDDGFREASGYDQARVHLGHRRQFLSGELDLGLTATRLRQDSAGFIYGRDAYEDRGLARSNPDAGAFRNADAQRLYGRWASSWRGWSLDLRPYLRHSSMSFMHYALPGRPVEDNGQTSGGMLLAFHSGGGDGDWSLGLDLDRASMYLRQRQDEPAPGPPRVSASRPMGHHYDYDVRSLHIAPFVRWSRGLGPSWRLEAGLRWEHMRYEYDNHLPDGNVRDDGQPCGFGGCFYTRPADRDDRFRQASPSLSASYRTGENSAAYLRLARGFRFPQAIELYRLQSGQQVADLDSETIDSAELGWRLAGADLVVDIAVYAMRKRDSVFRDGEGFNVSGARSRHRGVELSLDWIPAERWRLQVDATHARHRYDFDFDPGRGERFIAGRDMDTAPRSLGHAELQYRPVDRLTLALRWSHLGAYYLEPENRHRYPGHDLLDAQATFRLGAATRLLLQVNNLSDVDYADRADFGRGDYRYLPGRGRTWNLELQYRPDER